MKQVGYLARSKRGMKCIRESELIVKGKKKGEEGLDARMQMYKSSF